MAMKHTLTMLLLLLSTALLQSIVAPVTGITTADYAVSETVPSSYSSTSGYPSASKYCVFSNNPEPSACITLTSSSEVEIALQHSQALLFELLTRSVGVSEPFHNITIVDVEAYDPVLDIANLLDHRSSATAQLSRAFKDAATGKQQLDGYSLGAAVLGHFDKTVESVFASLTEQVDRLQALHATGMTENIAWANAALGDLTSSFARSEEQPGSMINFVLKSFEQAQTMLGQHQQEVFNDEVEHAICMKEREELHLVEYLLIVVLIGNVVVLVRFVYLAMRRRQIAV